ncbi:hypothetical protein E1A91_A12G112300v1 [Gossypium mustelinum]|uniref:phospholipase D n=1 Tax=Gossypium mustelinum TaxID=34275 RepID=A0A5D2WSI8_GOSMU|nr:hypothetical protein E1A91_A12G112300v1 [Gossypium mustelinum]
MDPYRNQYSFCYPHRYPPPPNQDPYPPTLYQPPPQYAYPHQSQSLHHYHSHSLSFPGPISFQHLYSAHKPILHHNASFQYNSQDQHPPPPENKLEPPPTSHGPGHNRQESTSSLELNTNFNSVASSIYPPLDDTRLTAPASPPAPSGPSLTTELQSPVDGNPNVGNFYGYPAHTISNHWDGGYYYRSSWCRKPILNIKIRLGRPKRSQNMEIMPFQKGEWKVLLLHGNLDIWVCDAVNIPNMDMFSKTIGDMIVMIPANVTNALEGRMQQKVTCDPYVTIAVANAIIGRTYVINNSENPVWMQHFNVPVAHYASEVHFIVKDSDVVGSQMIGIVPISVEKLYTGERIEGVYPILNSSGKPCRQGAFLRLSIQYIPMIELSFYHFGVGVGPDYCGVPGTYFPLRMGGKVTLYQDAHVPDKCLPKLKLDHGKTFSHGKCWSDIFDAIQQTRRLIYITGWSVWHKVRLVQDTCPSDYTLGDLLRSKSQEGVRVLLLLWDDPTSTSILGYKMDGIMQTHDEETRRFFKNSSVQVLLCPRIAGKRHSWAKQKEVGTIYTHHQKTIILDADAGENRRKIIAFVGGLDLCDGRYDSPHHPLFRTLKTLHNDDYHNPTFTDSVIGCPREPWHDMHCKIDGPAAYDVLVNFEERWLKVAKPAGIKKLKFTYDDALLRIERIQDIIGVSDFPIPNDNDPEAWHVQVLSLHEVAFSDKQIFRSIDSNSVKGFPKDPKEATSKNLVCGKNVLIDMSIHTAYVKAIRSAQHFIYIENQYFIGSSFNWNTNKDLGANNLIPMEIALKIANKIKLNERFVAYIIVPMWPEGVPTGSATQRILFWQNKTMQMMYETIYGALVEAGLENAFVPQDFLNFFCLGNREVDEFQTSGIANQNTTTTATTPQSFSRKNRKFMVYVHSKGMIVDDEYLIIGSANINQRSMEGTRDTEIAMGAYQPLHTWAKQCSAPHGQIYGYRMSLWAEHLGVIEECFTQPESLECVRRVKHMAEMNWKQFAADEITEMKAHLLKYPVKVDRKGKVRPLPGCETFPDCGGHIVGSFLGIQENLTI